jgi:hypothetical protein
VKAAKKGIRSDVEEMAKEMHAASNGKGAQKKVGVT